MTQFFKPQTSPIIVQEVVEPENFEEQLVKSSLEEDEIKFDSIPEECSSKDRIFFLKTHKTASSVIENIMFRSVKNIKFLSLFSTFRYGKKFNKTFAMPSDGGLVFNYQVPFKKQMVYS